MSSTNSSFDIDPERLASLEARFRQSRSIVPYSHNRVDSGDIVGAGDQFTPPRPQTSWPRHVEIAPEDLEPQNSAAGDLAVEVTRASVPLPRRGRISRSRGGSRSTPHLASAFSCQSSLSSEDVDLLIQQRDGPQHYEARRGPSSDVSLESVTSASSPAMSEDDDVSGTQTATPTPANIASINASRPCTPPPRSVVSTEDGCGNLEDLESSPPWSSMKRKRVATPDDDTNEQKRAWH